MGMIWADLMFVLGLEDDHRWLLIIIEEVGPIGETRGFTKGEHEDETRSGELEACSSLASLARHSWDSE